MKATKKPKPSRKATNAEIAERIQAIATAISEGSTRAELHELGRKQWSIHWRTVDEYSVRAREELVKAASLPRAEMRAKVLAIYNQALQSESEWPVRLRALEGIRGMCGLDDPKRQQVELDVPAPVTINQEPEMSQDEIDTLMVWRVGRVITKLGLEIDGSFAKIHALAGQRKPLTLAAVRSTTTPATTAAKSGPPVEIIEPSPAATPATAEPEAASSTWTPLIPEVGRSFDETSITPPAAERARRKNGGGILGGLF